MLKKKKINKRAGFILHFFNLGFIIFLSSQGIMTSELLG